MTEEAVAPLDAYVTAKPDEPVFTLQGGDPLGPPLVRLWAILARLRAGIFQPASLKDWVDGVVEVARSHSMAHIDRERDSLLIRASAAEDVSWSMDEYQQGHRDEPVDVPSEAAETTVDELKRIELFDLRVRVAQRLSNFRCEIVEMRGVLDKFDEDPDRWNDMLRVEELLRELNEKIEPRRIMKKDQA